MGAARVSIGSIKKNAIKLFQFCVLKTQHRCVLQEGLKVSKRALSSPINSLHDFLKTFDEARKCLEIPVVR